MRHFSIINLQLLTQSYPSLQFLIEGSPILPFFGVSLFLFDLSWHTICTWRTNGAPLHSRCFLYWGSWCLQFSCIRHTSNRSVIVCTFCPSDSAIFSGVATFTANIWWCSHVGALSGHIYLNVHVIDLYTDVMSWITWWFLRIWCDFWLDKW